MCENISLSSNVDAQLFVNIDRENIVLSINIMICDNISFFFLKILYFLKKFENSIKIIIQLSLQINIEIIFYSRKTIRGISISPLHTGPEVVKK